MKKKNVFLFFMFFTINGYCQNVVKNSIIIDKIAKLPLENVKIYNRIDNTTSNEDGHFYFISGLNDIHFSLLGYEDVNTSFDEIKRNDTVFMESKAIELEEVIVSNGESIIKKAHAAVLKNYLLAPYSENFFLRCLLKKDNEIIKLQDIAGKVSRETMFETFEIKDNKYNIEILNMRKTSLTEKSDMVHFEFPNFDSLYNMMNSILLKSVNYYNYTEKKSNDKDYWEVEFMQKDIQSNGQRVSGYFIIKKIDFAIVKFYLNFYDNTNVVPYQEKKGHKFRTKRYEFSVSYAQNSSIGKYYLNGATFDMQLEILGDKKIEKTSYYDFAANYITVNSFTNETIKSNFSVDKEIFKAKFQYSDEFWKNQNQLPLTKDLKDFLNTVAEKKDKKEFEIIGNF